jgi:uncharacterized protein DUF3987
VTTMLQKDGPPLSATEAIALLDKRRRDDAAKRFFAREVEEGRIRPRQSEPEPEDEDEEAEPVETRTVITAPDKYWPAPPDEAAFYGIAGDIVRAVQDHTEADRVGLLATFLTIMGTVAGPDWALHQGGWQHPNIFSALVGPTSIGRKGTAFGAIDEVFKLLDPEWQRIIITGLGSGEGLITHLQGVKEDPRALVLEPEFGRLLAAMGREGSTLSPIIRNAWDGAPLGRKVADPKQSGMVYKHHVGLLVNITDYELASKLSSGDAANGFANRFLWLAVRRPHLLPFTEPVGHLVQEHVEPLHRALDFTCQPQRMRMSKDARVEWERFYRALPDRGGLIAKLTDRGAPYVARLAMLYAMLDLTATIEVVHLRAAEALWDYASRSALYIFGDSTGDRDADALLRILTMQEPGKRVMSWDELKRQLAVRSTADMERVVGHLERLGRVRIVKVLRPGGGRPRRDIELVE